MSSIAVKILKKVYRKLPYRFKKLYRKLRKFWRSEYRPAIDSHEEIKRLLEELEPAELTSFQKRHTHFFQEDREFFFIDSENLGEIKSQFYGFSIQETGIFENANITKEALQTLDGRGAYVSVEADGEQIRIRQDYNGSYGLYLYQSDEYFAISNSFFYLLEHLKSRDSLSLNKDYANELLLQQLCAYTCSETAVEQIQLLERDLEITIDKSTGTIQMHPIDYQVDELFLDTEEGIQMLDQWFEKWTSMLHSIAQKTDYISADLSGGFDSRLTFMLLLQSEIDLNRIQIRSIEDDQHTHTEDYQIASAIAEHFGFRLNSELKSARQYYSICDMMKIDYYTKMAIHKQMYHKRFRYVSKHLAVRGSGGETKRRYWSKLPSNFIKFEVKKATRFSKKVGKPMAASERKILKRTFQFIRRKYQIEDKMSRDIPAYTYREGRCRSHFGKSTVVDSLTNCCTLAPLLDPDLGKINPATADCIDKDLLLAVIFDRYCPDLLSFPFEGDREIIQSTIDEAKKINERFPYKRKHSLQDENREFVFVAVDEEAAARQGKKNNPYIPFDTIDEFVKAVALSEKCRELFLTCFDEEIYYDALKYAKENEFYPLRYCYGILGLTAVLYDMKYPEASAMDWIADLLE